MVSSGRSFVLVGVGFVAGLAVSAGFVYATAASTSVTPSHRSYLVSIDEVKQNFVWAQRIDGEYKQSITMSDGSVRDITLRPVIKDGRERIELTDRANSGLQHSYMGPNGTTIDGNLMIGVKDVAELQALMQER